MRAGRLSVVIMSLIAFASGLPARAERMITDSAAREVAVPDRVERVFAAGPAAAVLLYVLAPDRMIGSPRAPHPEELPYIAPAYRDLPEVGWLTGRGDSVNLEVLLQSRPDLIFDFGSARETYVALAERVPAQTGIPYILIDGTFENTPDAVRLLGDALGVEELAEGIAAYVALVASDLAAQQGAVSAARIEVGVERAQQQLLSGMAMTRRQDLEPGVARAIEPQRQCYPLIILRVPRARVVPAHLPEIGLQASRVSDGPQRNPQRAAIGEGGSSTLPPAQIETSGQRHPIPLDGKSASVPSMDALAWNRRVSFHGVA